MWGQANRLFEGLDGLVMAVSGGADSVALAVALHRLVAGGQLKLRLVVGHINHGLRGAASDGDEVFVRRLAAQLRLPVICRRVDVTGCAKARRLSIETAGRVLRLEALARMAQAEHCQAIATGHQADDQAETVIHRLLRGTALRGLCGIRPMTVMNGRRFIRPLLDVRRADIEAYLRDQARPWREDASNVSTAFTRNRIRHRLLPALQRQSPDISDRLNKLVAACREAQHRIENAADTVGPIQETKDRLVYARQDLITRSPWVQADVFTRAAQRLGGGLRDLSSRHYQTLMAQLAGQSQTKTLWPGTLTVAVDANSVIFTKPRTEPARLPSEPVRVDIGKTAFFGPYTIDVRTVDMPDGVPDDFLRHKPPLTERLDAGCIEGPLTARLPEPGDRFHPIGLGAEKKVARFLLDSKIEKSLRKRVFVLTDSQKILYLAPLRLDERAKITPQTRKILEISIAYPY